MQIGLYSGIIYQLPDVNIEAGVLGKGICDMDTLVVLALAVAVIVCALPGLMAWKHYSSSKKHAAVERPALRHAQPAKA